MSRETLREVLAELLGTFVLILFGAGVVAQNIVSKGSAASERIAEILTAPLDIKTPSADLTKARAAGTG